MTGPDRQDWTPMEREALAALQSMPAPAAPSSVRAAARDAFLSAPVRRSPAPRRAAVAVLLTAAVAVVALFFVGRYPTAEWRVTDLLMPQDALVNGASPALGMTLGPATVVTEPCAEVEVQLAQDIRLRILGGSEVALPAAPGRFLRRDVALDVTSGEVFGTTGGQGLGYTFRLSTPEAEATLTGTTFAVFRTEDATCFCLFAGSLQIQDRINGQAVDLPVGKRVFVYKDGRAPAVEPLDAMEQMKLQMIDEQGLTAID